MPSQATPVGLRPDHDAVPGVDPGVIAGLTYGEVAVAVHVADLVPRDVQAMSWADRLALAMRAVAVVGLHRLPELDVEGRAATLAGAQAHRRFWGSQRRAQACADLANGAKWAVQGHVGGLR